MSMYFCYEKMWTGKWEPVVYHDDVPSIKSANGTKLERTKPIVVSKEFISNGEPIFGKLIEAYPLT